VLIILDEDIKIAGLSKCLFL